MRILAAATLLAIGLGVAWPPSGSMSPFVAMGGCKILWAAENPDAEGWREEFADLSAKGSLAMTFSREELLALIARCDALRPAVEQLEETPRKVYLKRLQKLKSLYLFILDTREDPKL